MFFISSTDRVKLAVYDYNTCGSKTVFLVHGWPLSHKIYEYQIRCMTDQGYRVVAIDLRGFGNSDAPSTGYCYNQMADDIHCVISALNLSNLTLVGFSMGGAIVLRYMNRYCGYGVTKLLLLSAAAPSWIQRPEFPYGLPRNTVEALIDQASTDRPQLAYDFSHNQLFASPQSEAAKNWFEDIALSASGIGTVKSAYALRDEDGRRDLMAVHVPTIIIHGKKDQVVTNDLVYIQQEQIKGSTLYQLENSGHGIMYDELSCFNQIFLNSI